ncbi:MAG: aminoacyl-tRNA hydrolase [Clostridia bacterium]|nr:aminoacyl-tRNA hydrolase [Clostridia bacterium]
MYVVCGLGNPGKKYENTRHNMGFITVDQIAEKLGIKVDKIKHKSLVGEGNIAGQKVLLVKPQTYMNLSGEAVREIMTYYKVPIENLIVIYDDIDLETGVIRLRKKGSSGTHNGMRNIIYQIQDDNFPRIRIGIGSEKKGDLASFVTGNVTKKEIEPLEDAILRARDSVFSIIEDGIDRAMNTFNTRNTLDGKETD